MAYELSRQVPEPLGWHFPPPIAIMQYHPSITPGGTVLLHSRRWEYSVQHCRVLQKGDRLTPVFVKRHVSSDEDDDLMAKVLADGGFAWKRLQRSRIRDGTDAPLLRTVCRCVS